MVAEVVSAGKCYTNFFKFLIVAGASDDTVSCCVMLEVLRVMSRNRVPYMHSITFIFNGAEENILQVISICIVFNQG